MATQSVTLQNIPLFQTLSLDDINILDDYLGSLSIAVGEVVFQEGDSGDYVCFVIDGTLDVIKKGLNGQERTIAQIPAGRSIGEMALIDSLQRSATVRGQSACRLRVLHRDNFEQLMAEHPAIAAKILHYMVRSLSLALRRTSNKLADNLEAL
ncbi:MAG: cyclic nucleotide-binding domain-containing protein [Gammaproteobacteria bacterium]